MSRSGDLMRSNSLLQVCLIALALKATPATATAGPVQPHRSIVPVLSTSHVVARGVVLGAGRSQRRYIAACGGDTLQDAHAFDTTLRLTGVLLGTLDDSIVVISTVGRPFPTTSIGAEVLFWGLRLCQDSWRLWGWYCGLDDSGALVIPPGDPDDFYRLEGQLETASLATVDSALQASASASIGPALTNAVALQLCRVTAVHYGEDRAVLYTVDTLRTFVGAVSRRVTSVRIVWPPSECAFYVSPGDSLLVPVRLSDSDDVINIDGCISALLVRNGYVPSYGVPLEFLHAAVLQEGGVIRRRRILYDPE